MYRRSGRVWRSEGDGVVRVVDLQQELQSFVRDALGSRSTGDHPATNDSRGSTVWPCFSGACDPWRLPGPMRAYAPISKCRGSSVLRATLVSGIASDVRYRL